VHHRHQSRFSPSLGHRDRESPAACVVEQIDSASIDAEPNSNWYVPERQGTTMSILDLAAVGLGINAVDQRTTHLLVYPPPPRMTASSTRLGSLSADKSRFPHP